jgi:hypothetical protein
MFDSELNVFSIFDNSWARPNFDFNNLHRRIITAVL